MTESRRVLSPSRRSLLGGLAAGGGLALVGHLADVLAARHGAGSITRDGARPELPYGVMSGDVTLDAEAPARSCGAAPTGAARIIVDYAFDESMRDAKRIVGVAAMESSDFTARADLIGLPPRAVSSIIGSIPGPRRLQGLQRTGRGRLLTPPSDRRSVTFAFSGDEAGQGWGINEAWGGYRVYEAMRKFNPDFFIHSGDQIYADGPIVAEVKLEDGVDLEKRDDAGQGEGCRDARRIPRQLRLQPTRRQQASVRQRSPISRAMGRPRNAQQLVSATDARRPALHGSQRGAAFGARQAGDARIQSVPPDGADPERIYRAFSYGPSLDVFMLDERSYRGPNTPNRQSAVTEESAFLGRRRWHGSRTR